MTGGQHVLLGLEALSVEVNCRLKVASQAGDVCHVVEQCGSGSVVDFEDFQAFGVVNLRLVQFPCRQTKK